MGHDTAKHKQTTFWTVLLHLLLHIFFDRGTKGKHRLSQQVSHYEGGRKQIRAFILTEKVALCFHFIIFHLFFSVEGNGPVGKLSRSVNIYNGTYCCAASRDSCGVAILVLIFGNKLKAFIELTC